MLCIFVLVLKPPVSTLPKIPNDVFELKGEFKMYYRQLRLNFATFLLTLAVCNPASATSPSSGTTSFGTGGGDATIASGAGSSGVTATDVAGTGWDIRVQTTTGVNINIARGDLVFGTGDGVYYTDGALDGEPLSSFRVTSNDGKLFDLQSFQFSATDDFSGDGTLDFTVTGYKSGAPVSGATQNFSLTDPGGGNWPLGTVNVSGNTNFIGIDAFAITKASGEDIYFFAIDNINVLNVRAPDTTPPTVSSVSVPSNDTYITGETLSFTINTSENVIVNTGGGTPRIALTIGATTKYATYSSGTGTSALVFSYTVESGLLDSDGIAVGALGLNSGTMKDAANNDMTLTLNSVGATTSVLVDSTAPTVSSVTASTADGTYKIGDTISIQVNFSESVTVNTGGGNPQLTLETGATDRTASYVSGTGSTQLTFSYTVQAGDNSSDLDYVATNSLALNGGTIQDAAGNSATLTLASPSLANSLGANKALVIDGVVPTVSSVNSSTADGSYKAGDSISIQINFSESVTVNTGGGTPQLTLETGATDRIASYTGGTGSTQLTFSYTVQAGDNSLDLDYFGINSLAANGGTIQDAAGNNATLTLASPGAANSLGANKALVVDAVAPSVTSIAPTGSPAANAASMDFAVAFDESVSNISTDDFTLVETGAAGSIASVSAASGSSITVTVNTITGTGTLKLNLNGSTNIVDAAGNGIAAYSSGTTHSVDRDAPAAPSTPDLDAASDTGASNTDNNTSDNTPTFTGTAEANATVTVISSLSGTLGTTTADGSGNWSYTANAMANGIHNITATATDAATNVSAASAALAVTIDGPVTVTTNADAGADATIDGSLATDLADGAGLSLREAFAYVAASGTVDFAVGLSGFPITLGTPLTVPANITLDADALGTATITGSTFTLAGSLTLTNGSGDILTLGSELTGAGALSKTGAGNIELTNTNNSGSYSGGISITAGDLLLTSDAAFSSGTLTLNGGALSNNNASFNLDNNLVVGASGGTVRVIGAGNTLTLSGNISGSGALSKASPGTLVLSGTNSFSGGLSVAGTNGVTALDAASLGSGTVTLNASSLLDLDGPFQTITNNFVLAGDATIRVDNATQTLTGVISGTGALTVTGTRHLELSGTNTATGAVTVQGFLVLSNGNALADSVAVTINSGELEVSSGSSETIASIASTGGRLALQGTLTVGSDNSSTSVSGPLISVGSLIKVGTGTLTLADTSNFYGAAQVSAGTLLITDSLSNSSGVSVASGATLAGTGTAPAVTIASGGNLSPGNAGPGRLAIAGNLVINSGGNLVLDVAGTTAVTQYDQVDVAGTVAISGANISVTHSYVAANGDTYNVITNDGADAITGTFSGIAEGGSFVAGGNSSNLITSYESGDGNDLRLTNTLLPGVPTAVTAVAGNASVVVSFTAPASNGGSAITGYTVTANPGGATATGAASPLTVLGLTNGVSYTFTVTATNATGTGSASTASSAVTPVQPNSAPVIAQGGSTGVTMSEDGTPTPFSLSLSATDSDNDTLSWSISGVAQHGSASVSGGSVSYTPVANFHGSDSFTVQVSDGDDTDSITVNVTVTPVNDVPVISGAPSTSLDQDTAYSFTPTASDLDTADVLTFSISNPPTWASFNTATGALTGTPAGTDSGKTIGIVISVNDGTTSTALPAFDIEVISTIDPLQPVVTAPAELNVDAIGLFTPITLRQLLGINVNATQGEVDAAVKLLAQDGVSGNDCCITIAEGLTAMNALLLAPGRHEIKWKATNAVGVTGETVQVVNIKPLVSLSKSQVAVRGSDIEFRVLLNGPSPVYPFTVPYVVNTTETTATAAEHNLASGTATFTQSGQVEVAIPVALADVTGFSDSKLVVALGSGINTGAANTHVIDIRQGNVPPIVSLSISQGGISTSLISPTGGAVTVTATVVDANKADTHTFDWSATSGLADTDGNPTNASRTFDPTGLNGSHQLQVTVVDSGGASVQASAYFRVVSALPVLNPNTDTDQDGINDQLEGTGDTDDNGIPDYLDNMPSPNILPQQGNTTNAFLIECDPGVRCGLGLYARSSGSGGVQVLDQEIGQLNDLVVDPAFEPVGGIFDFAIRDLPTPGQSVRIVIPQRTAIPANAVYRKYQRGSWVTFVSDADNSLHSAAGNPGYCPPPGAAEWTSGLTAGHMCVQLTIEDGGPNDDDGLVNSAVVDPGAVSEAKEVVEPPVEPPKPPKEVKTSGGGGAIGALLLIALGGLLIGRRVKHMKKVIALLSFGLVSGTQASPADNVYLRADVYQVNGSQKAGDFNAAIKSDFNYTLSQYDVDRTGYQLSLGYEWNKVTYTEVGYLDLGDVTVDLTLAGTEDESAFGNAMVGHYPITADGVTLVQGYIWSFADHWQLSPELGLFMWSGDIDTKGASFNLKYDDSTDLLTGLRLDYHISEQFGLGAGARYIRLDDQHVTLWGVSGRFSF